jgi:hypothetical protein
MSSVDLHDIEFCSAESIAKAFLSFPGARLIHRAKPSWWEWRGRWESGADFIEIDMSLFDDEGESWGGSAIMADCSVDQIDALWSHLQSENPAVWLHDPECMIHTHASFREAMRSQGPNA